MRLLEIILSENELQAVEQLLEESKIIEHWTYTTKEYQVIKILIQGEEAKEFLIALEKIPIHRLLIYPIEGTLPEVSAPIKEKEEKLKIGKFVVLSKEELFNDIDAPINLSTNYLLMVVLSAFVAGIGILKNNMAIIIGAMVIAPFLGPNMSLAFGTTLGDLRIIKKSIMTGIVATVIALIISMVWGYTAEDVIKIAQDPAIEYQDLFLALICGFAGVLSVISGQGTTLVGVMVAAALLPPLMRAGLLLGANQFSAAVNSFLIFGANIICLNIAGIITFYFSGIRPGSWWDKEKAKKKTQNAFFAWMIALLVLMLTIFLIKKF